MKLRLNVLVRRRNAGLLVFATLLLLGARSARADFMLQDGDTVVFLGDSITAARGYTKIVEHYTLMRFPNRRVRFFNAGVGGDTASGAVTRLDRDVFSQRPTVVTVAFGINDIGWGTKADDAHKKAYLDGIRTIVEQCKAHGARPVICSAAIPDVPPDSAEKGYLQTMCDEGLALAKSLGADTVDIQRGMREIQRRILDAEKHEKGPAKRTRLHVQDGVHLNDLGHLAMGYVLLKGLGAPAEVSAVDINSAAPDNAVRGEGCRVTAYAKRSDGVEFTRLDEGLPLNLGVLSALNYRWIPVPDGINGYRLKVKGLPPGEYEILAEGRSLGKEKSDRLAVGVNISSNTGDGWAPGGPWDAQSDVVKRLVDSRNEFAASAADRDHYLPNHPQIAALEADTRRVDNEIVALQWATAKPYPYRFVIRRVGGQ